MSAVQAIDSLARDPRNPSDYHRDYFQGGQSVMPNGQYGTPLNQGDGQHIPWKSPDRVASVGGGGHHALDSLTRQRRKGLFKSLKKKEDDDNYELTDNEA